MTFRLADKVQVRKESWGLLFYRQTPHKMCFVRSGDWLYPRHFNGSWTEAGIIDDIARSSGVPAATDIARGSGVPAATNIPRGGGVPAAAVKLVLLKLLQRLESGRLITHEVR